MDKQIQFFAEAIEFTLRDKNVARLWLSNLILVEGYQLQHINFIFCDDKYLHKINLKYLNHDNYTDIITFDNSTIKKTIESDIFISIQRIKENAKDLHIPFKNELYRVLCHGVLHLCGYKDKSARAKQRMTAKEDYYLSLLPFL